jgi:NADPH-dependent glutamate synthase beta subunit-like oxidoreductase
MKEAVDMLKIETEAKCLGCGKTFCNTGFDTENCRPTWFARFNNQTLLKWVCLKCWDLGKRLD